MTAEDAIQAQVRRLDQAFSTAGRHHLAGDQTATECARLDTVASAALAGQRLLC